MEHNDRIGGENWMRSGLNVNQFLQKCSPDSQYFSVSSQFPNQVEWGDSSFMNYEMRSQDFAMESMNRCSSSFNGDLGDQIRARNEINAQCNQMLQDTVHFALDPNAMLKNLSFLEMKIHQLQDTVHSIAACKYQARDGLNEDEFTAQQQRQLVSADLTSIFQQLISTAGSLLPSATRNNILISNLTGDQLDGILSSNGGLPQYVRENDFSELSMTNAMIHNEFTEQNLMAEEPELKDEEDVEEGEHLPPGSYEILQLEREEILAPHTHFCTICGKGFKRDANLRMHMRGHGDKYKSPAALAKPAKEFTSEPVLSKRYSCPYSGCKRNKDHKKFQPLKTMLCVKNHYKRSHCDKSFSCSRCNNKKFSVIADLKTHEKHCGRDKWLCSCGTTFSRKDKLFGHIALFQGHTPAIPPEEKNIERTDISNKIGSSGGGGGGGEAINLEMVNYKANEDDSVGCFSPINFDPCNMMMGFEEFSRGGFDDGDGSFSFLNPGSFGYDQNSEK